MGRGKSIRSENDVRRTFRVEEDLIRRIDKMAEANSRSSNSQIEHLLKVATGQRGFYPTVLRIEGKAYYALPIGTYGPLSSSSFKRFITGAPPVGSERWDSAFDTFWEALDGLGGTIVCELTDAGLRIVSINDFLDLCKEFKL